MKKIVLAAIAALYASVAVAEADDAQECYRDAAQGNYQQALKSCTAPAEQGDAYAQFALGVMYRNGQGVLQDYLQAEQWLRAAAKQGYAKAQGALGVMYKNGRGVEQDYSQAVRWYRAAAEQGLGVAQGALGVMYENGHGVIQSYVQAHMWYNIASANSNDTATELRELRDGLAAKMSSEQIAEAQSRAQQCMTSNYTDC